MIVFLNKFTPLSANQIWFLTKQNTSDSHTELLYKAYDAIKQDRILLTIFPSLSKAFDTVDHEVLQKNILLLRLQRENIGLASLFF